MTDMGSPETTSDRAVRCLGDQLLKDAIFATRQDRLLWRKVGSTGTQGEVGYTESFLAAFGSTPETRRELVLVVTHGMPPAPGYDLADVLLQLRGERVQTVAEDRAVDRIAKGGTAPLRELLAGVYEQMTPDRTGLRDLIVALGALDVTSERVAAESYANATLQGAKKPSTA